MSTSITTPKHPAAPDPHQDTFSITQMGFWLYLMSDCILFATLFASYAVLHQNTFGGVTPKELFKLSTALTETLILLVSSVTSGFALLAACRSKPRAVIGWFIVTFALGAAFVTIEINEFAQMVREGHSWRASAFLSSFFTLVGTHGLHVSFGLLWMVVMMFQIAFAKVTTTTFRRLVCLSMFWHFLDLVWIFIFTFVYLMGVL